MWSRIQRPTRGDKLRSSKRFDSLDSTPAAQERRRGQLSQRAYCCNMLLHELSCVGNNVVRLALL